MLLNNALTFKTLAQLVLAPQAWQEARQRLYQHVARSVSLGVCGIVVDASKRVLLVRHTYREGWYFPGGGVGTRETLIEALTRELAEEAHISLDAAPVLHGMFLQEMRWSSNHVACFIVPAFHQTSPRPPDWEIAETGFFDVKALPEGTTRATQERLDEVLHHLPPAQYW